MRYCVQYSVEYQYRDNDNRFANDTDYYTVITDNLESIPNAVIDDMKDEDTLSHIIESYAKEWDSYDGAYEINIENISIYSEDIPNVILDKTPEFVELVEKRKKQINREWVTFAKNKKLKQEQNDRIKFEEFKRKYGWK